MPPLKKGIKVPKKEFEFTLVLSGINELSQKVLDGLFEAGCDDALIGMRDGVAFADFTREAKSFDCAIQSAIQDVERAGVGAMVEHIEPDETVNMSEIARRIGMSREGVRKWIEGQRGPGGFPVPAAGLKQRSPLWRWTDVLLWCKTHQLVEERSQAKRDDGMAEPIAVYNAALSLRRHIPMSEAMRIMKVLSTRKQNGRGTSHH